jgi:uncharacterized membrane protein
MKNPSASQNEAWHQDPNNWKYGIFYYNKEDERLFPLKKIKELGWTVNFANYKSYGLLTLLMLILAVFSIFITAKN